MRKYSMNARTNKKGTSDAIPLIPLFIYITVIVAVALLFGLVLGKFTNPTNEYLGLRQSALSATIQEEGLLRHYLTRALTLTAQEALFNTANASLTPRNTTCGTYLVPLWTAPGKECYPNPLPALTTALQPLLDTALITHPAIGAVPYNLKKLNDDPLTLLLEGNDTINLPITLANQLEASPAADPTAIRTLLLPLPGRKIIITSCWGERTLQNGQRDFHDGIDLIGMPFKDPATGINNEDNVILPASADIIYSCGDWNNACHCTLVDTTCPRTCRNKCADYGTGYGNTLIAKHDNGLYTRFAHLDDVVYNVNKGDTPLHKEITALVGKVGNTGYSEAKHLHWSIYLPQTGPATDKGVNPLCFLKPEEFKRLQRGASARSCAKYSKNPYSISPDDPVLAQECAPYWNKHTINTLAFPTAPQAALSQGISTTQARQLLTPSQQKNFEATKKNLEAIGMNTILNAIENAKTLHDFTDLPASLVLAIITVESKGDKNAIGYNKDSTDRGLMMINDKSLPECQQACKITTPEELFDVQKNICCGVAILKQKRNIFSNGISKSKAQQYCPRGNPNHDKWLTYTGWQATLRGYNGWYCERNGKTVGDPDYVEKVMAYLSAWGGDALLATQDPTKKTPPTPSERVFGTLTFVPNATTTLPFNFTSFTSLIAWAKATTERCATENGANIQSCVEDRINHYQGPGTITRGACPNNDRLSAFATVVEALADCHAQPNQGCLCDPQTTRLPPPPPGTAIRLTPDGHVQLINKTTIIYDVALTTQFANAEDETQRPNLKEATLWSTINASTPEPFLAAQDLASNNTRTLRDPYPTLLLYKNSTPRYVLGKFLPNTQHPTITLLQQLNACNKDQAASQSGIGSLANFAGALGVGNVLDKFASPFCEQGSQYLGIFQNPQGAFFDYVTGEILDETLLNNTQKQGAIPLCNQEKRYYTFCAELPLAEPIPYVCQNTTLATPPVRIPFALYLPPKGQNQWKTPDHIIQQNTSLFQPEPLECTQ
ncbi:hypothetical protein D6783_05045 [Candidatus Woesearchaeota archaeon]|nr:MAG: hypothetical protein D6783_05045 [Candidatus Woesearchaeota archaeon]